MTTIDSTTDPWAGVIGQPEVVRRLSAAVGSPVHAYMFVGPHGAGKRRAAAAFAGELLAAADPEGADRHRALALREQHPDVHVVDPTGNQLRRDEEAEPLIVEASRSPVEGERKVLVVNRFHTATPAAAVALLKTIEEPAPTSIFVLMAEQIPPEHVTIASRCTRVDFPPVPDDVVAAALASEGLATGEGAELVASAARGNLDRARVLATDDRVLVRRDAWWSIPDRLDGSGAAVAAIVIEIRDLITEALEPLAARHTLQLEELDEREERLGTRGSGRRDVESRHRREQRQFRTDELRFGLATLAARYRELIESDCRARRAIDSLRATSDALIRNPNEALALQALLVDLSTGEVSG